VAPRCSCSLRQGIWISSFRRPHAGFTTPGYDAPIASSRKPDPSEVARPSAGALAIAAIGLLAFLVSARAWAFLCDDAFISFRYAENLAEHGALVFNPGLPERVEGYTNFLWVIVLAGLSWLGLSPPSAAPALTLVGALGGLVAVTGLVVALRRRFGETSDRLRAIDLVPALLLAVQPEYVVWSHSGLETSTAAALVLGAMWAWTCARFGLAAGLAAAAGLVRSDALLPIAAFGLAWLAVVGGPAVRKGGAAAIRSLPWRALSIAAAIFVVPLALHLLWRHAYYGQWLPNTWAVKQAGRLLRDTWGVDYVRAWVAGVGLVYVVPLVVLVRARHLLLLVPAAVTLAYAWWVGGDFMAYGRFLLPATACLHGLVGWTLADAGARFQRVSSRFPAVRNAPLLLGLGLFVAGARTAHARWELDRATPEGWIDGHWEGVATMDRFARFGWAAGRSMHERLPPDTLISVGAAGAVPYGSRLPTLDAYGLVDPRIARLPGVKPLTGKGARPGHQLYAPAEYIRERDPDLLCHVGHRGPTRPTRRHMRPGYTRGYAWACVDVQSDDLPEPGVYCCLRPSDRVVGPFGASEP
jgi:arabinofuranosyltransferase